MPGRSGRVAAAAMAGRQLEAMVGREIRSARLAAGLSQADCAHAARSLQTRISRIERGVAANATLSELATISATVGLRVWVRCYPTGAPIRDRAQVALLEAVRGRLAPSWRWRTEVPMPIPGDLRAADAVASQHGCTVMIEAWTRLADLQAQSRAAGLKRRDLGAERLVILLLDTTTNRTALRAVSASVRASFPLQTRAVLAALGAGQDPGADGVVLLRTRSPRSP